MLRAGVLIFLLGLTIPFAQQAFAQQTTIWVHEDADFKTALELFQKQKYGSAQRMFRKVIETHPAWSLVRIDAEYYEALSAIELFNKDGELLLKSFIFNHPESPRVRTAYFYLGKYNYRKKKYEDAIKWLDSVDVYELSKPDLSELYFKRGHSYFELGQYAKAKKDLYEIKDVDTRYSAAANYYFSHIAYLEKNYETALQGFRRLVGNESFGPVAPYYIAQLYYLQAKYDSVITYAPALLDSAGTKRAPEIARIIGESYYRTGRYKESIPYLKKYEAGVGMYPKDYYQLAYAYYKTGDHQNAITYFKNTVSGNPQDTLSQNAFYHLADVYLKTNNKEEARSAFGAAAKLDHDKQVKEDALYNYAKLSYELSYNPFSEAIVAFNEYIKLYPKSPRIDEAYSYLVNVYLTTRNYKEALASIEQIKNMNDQLKGAYQKIAYYRGVELFTGSFPEYDEAIKHFNKSLQNRYDKNISALALYWRGEAYFRKAEAGFRQTNNYNDELLTEAIDDYKAFQAEPGAFSMPEYTTSNYNIGYAYLHMDEYSNANIWFRKYITMRGQDAKDRKLSDAYVRTGDTYYMMKDFEGAQQNYSAAIDLKVRDVDYALYQRAMSYGLLQNREAKIRDLKVLSTSYPKSNYTAAGRFEMAKTMSMVGQNDEALAEFQKIISENPNSTYTGKAIMQMGLIHYAQGNSDKALEHFRSVIQRDNRSDEAKAAYINAKRIAGGNTDLIEELASMMGQSVSTSYLDSVAFDNAKKPYLELDCDKAIPALNSYIGKFPQGIFITEATFYKAECEYQKGNTDAALAAYTFVTGKQRGQFTEPSLAKAAYIYYARKSYNEALANFTKLEEIAENPCNITDARIGLMRSNHNLNKHDAAITYAERVLSDEKVTPEAAVEARLIIGRSALATEKYDLALDHFSKVASDNKNETGSEAKYNVGYIRYLQSDFTESKKLVFELIKQYTSKYWMAKGLILLADNYVALGDNFQAKHTLKSVIDNSGFPDLVKEAQQRLDSIVEKENQKMQKLPSEDIKIEFNESRLEYKQLFTEPAEEEEKATTPVEGGNNE